MELKRASLIQNTPPSTPRNSMLLVPPQTASSNNSQMFNLQEFLTRFKPEDSPGVVREMEESESPQQLRSRLRSSQQSVSQVSNRSRSSGSLHSAPSSTSISRDNPEHHLPVIANPAAMAQNLNNNNNNNNNNSDNHSQESAPVVAVSNYNMTGGSSTLVDGGTGTDGVGPNSSTPNYPKAISVSQETGVQSHSVISWGDASSISLSSNGTGDVRFGQGPGSQNLMVLPATHDMSKPRSYSVSTAYSETRTSDLPKSTSSEELKKSGKTKSKGRSLFKRHFHRSSDDLLEEPGVHGSAGKPLIQRKFHQSAFDLVETKKKPGEKKKKVDFREADGRVSTAFSLSGLTDLRQRGEMQIPGQRKKTKNSKRKSLQPKPVVPSRSQEFIQKDQESDELVSLTDMLSELDSTSLSQPAPLHLPPSSPRSPGQDSIWQEYGCV